VFFPSRPNCRTARRRRCSTRSARASPWSRVSA